MTKMIKILKRYTTLPILLDLLQRKKLRLLDPELWEDKNDLEIILEYKRKKNIINLFAYCLSHGDETIHHWKTFANGISGCAIEFDAQKLFIILDEIPNLRHKKVIYKKLSEIEKKSKPLNVNDIPFTKRWPYRCEEEYRIIVEGSQGNDTFFDIDIPLDIITRITINQRMPDNVYESIKGYLKNFKGKSESRISRSTLFENKRWINRFKK